MTLLILLLTVLLSAPAMGDSNTFLESNRAAVLRLHGDGAFASAYYVSLGGESITIRAESVDGSLDVVLELLDDAGHTIAYADAGDLDAPVISRIRLEDAVLYTVRVNTFNGEGSGDVAVTLTVEPPYILTPDAPSLRIPLGLNEFAFVSLDGFDLSQPLTIIASDPTGRLDALIEVYGDGLTVIAANDDHGTADPSLNRFDAQLAMEMRDDAFLRITDFLGRPGWLNVSIRP